MDGGAGGHGEGDVAPRGAGVRSSDAAGDDAVVAREGDGVEASPCSGAVVIGAGRIVDAETSRGLRGATQDVTARTAARDVNRMVRTARCRPEITTSS